MLQYLDSALPIIINILLVILLVLLIIISVKVIRTMNKVEGIVDNVDTKVNSLNGIFELIDNVVDRLSLMSDAMIDGIANFIQKIFKRKKKDIEEEKEDE